MPSFDVVSKLDLAEVDNAINQAQKELGQRFDFRGTETTVERTEEGVVLKSNAEARLTAGYKVLEEKLVKRKVSLKSLDSQKAEPAGGSTWRQLIKLKQGVVQEKAKEIVKLLKDMKMKVQASIQGDTVRISGKKKDDLQEAIAFLRTKDLDLPLQFVNFRD